MLRTFSKAYGLAGLRIGFLIGHEPVAEAIRKTMLPFTVNAIAQAAAVASLNAEDELLERVETIVKERDRVREALRAEGWTVPATEANFVWLRLGDQTTAFAQSCDAAAISIRPYAGRRRADLDRHARRERRLPRGGACLPLPGVALRARRFRAPRR